MNYRNLLLLFILALGTSAQADALKSNSVAARNLKANAVTSIKIASGAVTAAKLATSVGVFVNTSGTLTFGNLSLDSSTILAAKNGKVGIGTSNPTSAPLEISGSTSNGVFGHGLLTTGGASTSAGGARNLSIFASADIAAAAMVAFSDARTKQIFGVSDGAADLGRIMDIEITDYTYLDTLGKGTSPQKKVIAQQVETVFPQAVQSGPGVIPDIYQKAHVRDGWIQLATNLKVGERVRLIGGKGECMGEVNEVREGAFRSAATPVGDEVFVYGREVPDFRTVDYDALAMLNVSATQELARRLEEKDAVIKELTKVVELLEARDREREKRLVRLENSIRSESERSIQASVQIP